MNAEIDSMRRAEAPRVAVVAYTEYPWDSRVRREAEGLVADGYIVHAIVARPRSGPSATHIGDVHVHELPVSIRRGGKARYVYQYSLFFVLSTALLLWLHTRRRFDLVHVHSLPDFQVFCALPVRFLGAAILLDLHEAMPEIFAARFRVGPNSLWVDIAAVLERLSCRFANHVIVANDALRATVVRRSARADHVTTVYNSGDLASLDGGAMERVRALRLATDRLIVHAGGVNPERDLETLIRAVALLPNGADAHLVVAGEGDQAYVELLRQLARDLGIQDRIRFVGKLSREEAHALMSFSTVGVVTLEANPLTELAWPTRIVEFARLRKPLVVPRLHFLQATLEDGALYYSPGDPASLAEELQRAFLAPERREVAIAKAEAICRRFEWTRMRAVLLEICRSIGGTHVA